MRVLGDFSDRELRVIELRVRGMKTKAIATHMLTTYTAIHGVLMGIYAKAGVHNRAELKAWAVEHALDVPAAPDTPETAAVPMVKVRKNLPIRLGRIRRDKSRSGLYSKNF